MSGPTPEDFDEYRRLVNAVRRSNGLQPLTVMMVPDDPRSLNEHMREELGE